MLFVVSKICPYTHWTKHYLILALKETCFNYEIKDRDRQTSRFLSLLTLVKGYSIRWNDILYN